MRAISRPIDPLWSTRGHEGSDTTAGGATRTTRRLAARATARGGYGWRVEEMPRWAGLDDHLAPDVRAYLEERFWRPIEAQATLEVLRHDPTFFADPGRHPAMFADHGVVHVRDVAANLIELLETVDGVLLAARPPSRRRFMESYGVAAAYLHDVGMIDMSAAGRRIHAVYAAHAAFWPDAGPLVDHLLAPGPVRARLDAVAAADPFAVPVETIARELLSLTAAHSKTTVPAPVLDDRSAFRCLMQRFVFTSLDAQRRSAHPPALDGESPLSVQAGAVSHPDPSSAYAWLEAVDGPQAELTDDVLDALRALRAADVLRQRGSALRTSGGFEVYFDARTAHAVATLRPAGGDAAYVVTYPDGRGAGEANIRLAFMTPRGHLRIAFHRGAFAQGEVLARAAASAANAVLDIQADVLPSFAGAPARGLPAPARRIADVRIQLERPDDHPAFAEEVARVIATLDPSLGPVLQTVADVERAAAQERDRFHAAAEIEPGDPLVPELLARLDDHGATTAGMDLRAAFAEVCRVSIQPGEVLLARGSPPAFVYIPLGLGLEVQPEGGYAPQPVHPWVPVGTTGVIRRAGRNSDIVAEHEVEVIMVPGERYVTDWLRPLGPDELRTRLQGPVQTP
jgi:hypothetical protein